MVLGCIRETFVSYSVYYYIRVLCLYKSSSWHVSTRRFTSINSVNEILSVQRSNNHFIWRIDFGKNLIRAKRNNYFNTAVVTESINPFISYMIQKKNSSYRVAMNTFYYNYLGKNYPYFFPDALFIKHTTSITIVYNII